ncbi:hypothetical protein BKA93DRAFT_559488 [Sparassis latifolia]
MSYLLVQLGVNGLEFQARSSLEGITQSPEEATEHVLILHTSDTVSPTADCSARAFMKLGIGNAEDTTDISRKLANYDAPSVHALPSEIHGRGSNS